jgi:prolyl-tRNA editing enzyme YbaK/EbsC (Cys-tRNA(Pro) deacylase)
VTDVRAAAFAERLAADGIVVEVRETGDSIHTAQQAAAAIGCPVEAIVKSLLFAADGEPLLVLASGPNRVDTDLLSALTGAVVTMADAKTVKAVTGYSIGGVPPIGHPAPIRTIVDERLLTLPQVWAAAGSATAVFAIAPGRLVELSRATVARVT